MLSTRTCAGNVWSCEWVIWECTVLDVQMLPLFIVFVNTLTLKNIHYADHQLNLLQNNAFCLPVQQMGFPLYFLSVSVCKSRTVFVVGRRLFGWDGERAEVMSVGRSRAGRVGGVSLLQHVSAIF